MIKLTLNCPIKLFADDTKLYLETKDNIDENKLQDNIFSACAWSKKSEMSFNYKNCKMLHIGHGESSEYFIKDNIHIITKIHDVDKKLNFSQRKSTS